MFPPVITNRFLDDEGPDSRMNLFEERGDDVILDSPNLVSRMPICIKRNPAGPHSNRKVSSGFLNGNAQNRKVISSLTIFLIGIILRDGPNLSKPEGLRSK